MQKPLFEVRQHWSVAARVLTLMLLCTVHLENNDARLQTVLY
ncbi:Uncharacterised protein [Halioglobus japonicus]|nr:Uncharacterised protein [Halioglobus japonicus]